MPNILIMGAGGADTVSADWLFEDGDDWELEDATDLEFEEGSGMPDISSRPIHDELTEGEFLIVRDPAAALAQREHQVRAVPALTHLDATNIGVDFVKGDVIGRSGGAWVGADANNDIPALYMVWSVIDDDNVLGMATGKLTWTHGKTPTDAQYYLSTTAKEITDTKPGAGDLVQRICYVLDASTVLVNIGDPEE